MLQAIIVTFTAHTQTLLNGPYTFRGGQMDGLSNGLTLALYKVGQPSLA